jgi:hypothetical protein
VLDRLAAAHVGENVADGAVGSADAHLYGFDAVRLACGRVHGSSEEFQRNSRRSGEPMAVEILR